MELETNTTEAATIAALAVASAKHQQVDEVSTPFVIVPEGCRVHDLEETLLQPARKQGTLKLRDVDSFVQVVQDQADESTRIYRTVEPPRFVAVFNDHAGTPGWGDYRAVYDCPLSTEWRAWKGSDKRSMTQADFAQFIEDNLPDIVEPAAASMLEISRTLQAKKKVAFASAIRLDNGQQQFTYEEKIDGTSGAKGQIQVPEVFTIGVPVFEGGPRYAVRARLRYRISDQGALAMWFDLERPHKIIEDAVAQLKKVVEEATGIKTINGERTD